VFENQAGTVHCRLTCWNEDMHPDLRLDGLTMATVRRIIPSCDWDDYASAIVEQRRELEVSLRPLHPPSPETLRMVEHFRRTGFLQMPLRLDPAYLDVVRRYLEPQPVYAGPHIFSANESDESGRRAMANMILQSFREKKQKASPEPRRSMGEIIMADPEGH
jgi:hypothetical protein